MNRTWSAKSFRPFSSISGYFLKQTDIFPLFWKSTHPQLVYSHCFQLSTWKWFACVFKGLHYICGQFSKTPVIAAIYLWMQGSNGKRTPYLNMSGQGLVKVSLEKLNSSFTKLMVNTTKIQKKRKLICFVRELKLSDNTKLVTLITIRINDRDI